MELKVNWERITTMAVWVIILGMCGLVYPVGWNFYWEVYTPDTGLKDTVAVLQTNYQDASKERGLILEALKDLTANQQKAERRAMVIIGLGGQGSFGTDSPYVRININSNASSYAEESLVRITNLAVEGTPSSDMAIDGTFTNSNSNLKVMFSRRAADDLEIEGRMEIKLEPVIEETQ